MEPKKTYYRVKNLTDQTESPIEQSVYNNLKKNPSIKLAIVCEVDERGFTPDEAKAFDKQTSDERKERGELNSQ